MLSDVFKVINFGLTFIKVRQMITSMDLVVGRYEKIDEGHQKDLVLMLSCVQ